MLPVDDKKAATAPCLKAAARSAAPPTCLEFGKESSSGNVRHAAESADPNRFAFEGFSRIDRGLNHQLVIQHVDKTSNGDEITAAGGRVDDSASGNHADLDVIA